MSHHLGSEAIVSEEDVADAGDQDAGCHLVDELRTYMFRIFMYRRASGMERSPIEHPSHDHHGNDAVATQPTTSIMNSYLD